MSGIEIGIDPVAFQLGHFALRWYGLFFAIALLAGVSVGVREAVRKGLLADEAQNLALLSVVGGLVGARLFHVIDRWDLYADDPLAALAIWNGGLAVYGGLIGGVLTALAIVLWRRLPAWRIGDAAAPAMILGQGLGRLACIPNGDAYGAPAQLPWAFVYTNPAAMVPAELRGVPLHPYAVYELAFDLALFGVLWRLRDRGIFGREPGLLFLAYIVVYSAGRFVLSFYRVERVWFAGLQEAQVLSLLGLAIGLAFVGARMWSSRRAAPAVTLSGAGE